MNLGAQISLRKNEFLRIKKPQSIEDRDAWDCIQIMMLLCLFEMEDTQALYALTWGEIFFIVFQTVQRLKIYLKICPEIDFRQVKATEYREYRWHPVLHKYEKQGNM